MFYKPFRIRHDWYCQGYIHFCKDDIHTRTHTHTHTHTKKVSACEKILTLQMPVRISWNFDQLLKCYETKYTAGTAVFRMQIQGTYGGTFDK